MFLFYKIESFTTEPREISSFSNIKKTLKSFSINYELTKYFSVQILTCVWKVLFLSFTQID